MGQKFKLHTLFIYSPNSDGFYIFYISQGSVATQLRCGGMFSNQTTLLQIFHRMHQWKNFDNRSIFDKDMNKTLWLTFWGHPVYTALTSNFTWKVAVSYAIMTKSFRSFKTILNSKAEWLGYQTVKQFRRHPLPQYWTDWAQYCGNGCRRNCWQTASIVRAINNIERISHRRVQ